MVPVYNMDSQRYWEKENNVCNFRCKLSYYEDCCSEILVFSFYCSLLKYPGKEKPDGINIPLIMVI